MLFWGLFYPNGNSWFPFSHPTAQLYRKLELTKPFAQATKDELLGKGNLKNLQRHSVPFYGLCHKRTATFLPAPARSFAGLKAAQLCPVGELSFSDCRLPRIVACTFFFETHLLFLHACKQKKIGVSKANNPRPISTSPVRRISLLLNPSKNSKRRTLFPWAMAPRPPRPTKTPGDRSSIAVARISIAFARIATCTAAVGSRQIKIHPPSLPFTHP